jgi:hypothetical protein
MLGIVLAKTSVRDLARWPLSMARVFCNVVHSDLESDAILWDEKPFGKDGNHLCRGFNGIRDFLAPGGIFWRRHCLVPQSDLYNVAVVLFRNSGKQMRKSVLPTVPGLVPDIHGVTFAISGVMNVGTVGGGKMKSLYRPSSG